MGSRLVQKLVTLNDSEWRNVCVILPNLLPLWPYNVKVVEHTPDIRQVKCRPRNLVFSDVSLMVIFAGNHPQRGR